MYKHDVKSNDGYYAKAQAVPQNTSADGNGGSEQLSGTQGGIEIKAVVTTELALADTKVFSIAIHDSADNSSFAAIQTLYTITADGAETVAAGTVLGRFVFPSNARRYTKVILTSTDAAMTGAVDVYGTYLPR